jgi:dihydroflavonol-4-reductase
MSDLCLVTGAAGHLGYTIVRRLLELGRSVRALVLPGDRAAKRLPAQVSQVEGNVLDKESLRKFFDIPSGARATVIHCAAIVSTSSRFSQLVHDVNVDGTRNVLERCLAAPIRKLVHVSSVHAIPVLPSGQTMTEVASFDPDKVTGPYAKTKAEATARVLDAVGKGLDASVVFPAGICGPYDFGRGHVTQMIIDFKQGRLPIGVHGGFDFVDVRDVAEGVVACADRGVRGEGYILANRYVSVPELLDLLHGVTGRTRTKFYVPLWLAKAFVPFCGLYYRLRRQPPLFNSYSLHTLACNSTFSHEKASRELGYTVRPFSETIRDTVEWLLGEKRM